MTKLLFPNDSSASIEGRKVTASPAAFGTMLQDAADHLPDINGGWLPSVELYIAAEFEKLFKAKLVSTDEQRGGKTPEALVP